MKPVLYIYTSAEDIERAKALAAVRNGSKAHGVNHKWSARPDQDIHLLGILGEMAIAHLLGGNLDATARPGGDDGQPDVRLPDGRGVNVKTRTHSTYDFLLDPGKRELDADYGVLIACLGGTLTLQVQGYCTDDLLRRYGREVDYNHGPRWALAPHHFRPITELIKEL